MLHDPEARVRCAAATAAARAGDRTSVFSLILALEDPEPAVRRMAADAIEIITGTSVDADAGSEAESHRQVDRLKRWWKAQRFEDLAVGTMAGA